MLGSKNNNKPNYIYYIVKCQSICRKWLVSINNIFALCKKFKTLQVRFVSEIGGYHMLHKTPIKESVWEEINCNIVEGVFSIIYESMGSHMSGIDNIFDKAKMSNKTIKINKNDCNLSSYRLTNVCNPTNIGNPIDIINEIKERDRSFDYYSILIRDEKKNSLIEYMWYIIPKDYYIFKIGKLTEKTGKKKQNKGKIIGWESKNCDITFSMSSQLWYKFNIKDIEKYKVCDSVLNNNTHKFKYYEIYNNFL